MNHSASINMGRTTMCPIVTLFVYHSKKFSRNTDRFVSRARLFGSFHWKFSGKKRISEKAVPFSRWKLSDGNTDVLPPLTSSRPLASFRSLTPFVFLCQSKWRVRILRKTVFRVCTSALLALFWLSIFKFYSFIIAAHV